MERRLAAILAADMVGYSRLMAADEAETLARQKAHRKELIDPRIAEYGGRVVKSTGDGVLVEFPSVVDALCCAVTIQLAMREREAASPEENRIEEPSTASQAVVATSADHVSICANGII